MSKISIDTHKVLFIGILILGFVTRMWPANVSTVPKGHLPYLYGNALINLLNGVPLAIKIPHEGVVSWAHLESIFFILFLVPFKLLFSDTSIVLNLTPGFVGIITTVGMFMFVKELTQDKYVALFSAFMLVFNPFHAFTTKIASPDGLALGILLFLLYFFFNNRTIIAGILGGFILLTDYMVFGHALAILLVILLTDFKYQNFKKVGLILFLTILIAMPWQLYLLSISKEASISQFEAASPINIIKSPSNSFPDTISLIPTVISPITAFLIIFGLYLCREKKYFKFISANLILFFIISFGGGIGVPSWRHLLSLSIFSSISAAIFLNSVKTKRVGIMLLISAIIFFYFFFPLHHFVQVPKESQIAANWLRLNAPQKSIISSPTTIYSVLSEKPNIYESNPCENRELDYVIEDDNIERFPISYGISGVVRKIQNHNCLNIVYNTTNVRIYRIVK